MTRHTLAPLVLIAVAVGRQALPATPDERAAVADEVALRAIRVLPLGREDASPGGPLSRRTEP